MRRQILLISNLGVKALKSLADTLRYAPFKFPKTKEEIILAAGSKADIGLMDKLRIKKYFKFRHLEISVGAGTSYYVGQMIIDQKMKKLRRLLEREVDFRVIVAGLSGGTGTAFLTHSEIIDLLLETCDPKHTILITVLPGRQELGGIENTEDVAKKLVEMTPLELEQYIAHARYTKIVDVSTFENSVRRLYNLVKFFVDPVANKLIRSVRCWIVLVNEPTPVVVDKVLGPLLMTFALWLSGKVEVDGEDPANLHGLFTVKFYVGGSADVPLMIESCARADLPAASPAKLPREDAEVFPVIVSSSRTNAERLRDLLYRTFKKCRLGASLIVKAKRKNVAWILLFEKINLEDAFSLGKVLKTLVPEVETKTAKLDLFNLLKITE